jgi:hypothetical protein
MGTYRIGTFNVTTVTRLGNPKRDFDKTMAILAALAGVIEKRDLLASYPELGLEVNGIPVNVKGDDKHV